MRTDARAIPLRDGCVQCCVSSPPYWGLRSYGIGTENGEIGLEPTPEAYVATMVAVFREVRRVLRDDGTVWLNLGDSYASYRDGKFNAQTVANGNQRDAPSWGAASRKASTYAGTGIKHKDLVGIPWRVAFALQADGWCLRSDIVWAKPNPMPESVTDRPTRSHEYLFLLTKSERYYYDADAIREPSVYPDDDRKARAHIDHKRYPDGEIAGIRNGSATYSARNKRSVWTINSEPTPEAHFATFPQRLVEPCILAGTSEKGCCAECGAPRVRMTERVAGEPESYHSSSFTTGKTGINGNGRVSEAPRGSSQTTGWQPSCSHDAPSVPCLVFDPFIGSGTVGKVAERFGRRWVGLELSADYIAIAKNRTAQMGLQL